MVALHAKFARLPYGGVPENVHTSGQAAGSLTAVEEW